LAGTTQKKGHRRGSASRMKTVKISTDDISVIDQHGHILIRGRPGANPALVIEVTVMPRLLIKASIEKGDAAKEGTLVESVAIPWFAILRELASNPNFLFQIPWEKLEELIAGAYKQQGWPDVVLTPRSGDRGRDVDCEYARHRSHSHHRPGKGIQARPQGACR
jgi:hypothetical protein